MGGVSRRATGRLLAGAAAGLVAAGASMSGVLAPLENASIDARFGMRHTAPVTDIVIVGIDEDSIREQRPRQWPFRRLRHAQAVDRLRQAGARAIVYDVQFTEASARPGDDLALYDAIGRAGGATLATSISLPDGRTNVLGGDELLAQIRSRAGAADLPNDRGAIVRRYPERAGQLPSIAVVAAARISGRPLPASAFEDGHARIDFRGGLNAFPTISFGDLLAGRVPRERLRGKIVLVGATAPALQDSHATATSGSAKMAGVEVQAHALWTALHGNPLRDAPPWLAFVSMALLGFAVPLASLRLRPHVTILLAGGLAAAATIAAQVAFSHGVVVTVVGPLLALGLSTLATFIAGYALEARRRRVAAAYGRELELEVAARTSELRTTQLEVLQRLSQAAEQRDNETGTHLRRMSLLCGRLARATGMPEPKAEEIQQASLLHDIGKIGIPDEILHKPGRLTADERAVMQRHTTIGAELLVGSSSQLLRTAESIARTHHERWDGSGYPAGMAGAEIPLAGRIAAICDVYDALMTERPYKAAWTIDAALAHIEAERGRHFDPGLADCFVALIGTDSELSALMLAQSDPPAVVELAGIV
jgi:response regulator RpfG family c-di-GMP phosphodiesterase